MDLTFPSHMIWWITIIDIPVMVGFLSLIWRHKKDADQEFDRLHKLLETRHSQLRESLASYKLEVAKTYSTQNEMKILEQRLVDHLLRIEGKLDKQVERNLKGQ